MPIVQTQPVRHRPALNAEDLIRVMTESATQRAHASWAAMHQQQHQQQHQQPHQQQQRPLHGALDVAPTFSAAVAPGWTSQHHSPMLQVPTTGARPMTQNPVSYSQPQYAAQQHHQPRRASTPVLTKPAMGATTTVEYQQPAYTGAPDFSAPKSAPGFGPAGAVVSITTRIVGNQKFTRRVERYPAPDGSIRERVIEYVSSNTGTPHESHLRAPVTGR
jgi:hypothetical protein